MAMLATRERPAARDFVWPPPEDELDALEVVELRGLTPIAVGPRPLAPRAEPASTPLASIQPAPPQPAPIQPATPAPAASQSVPARATWHARVPRVAAITAMMLFATMVGILLGVRDARRSMTAGYSRLRESVVAVREYVEHVGTVSSRTVSSTTAPSTSAHATPTRPASTPARSRGVAVPPSPAVPRVSAEPLAAESVAAQPLASEPVASELLAATATPTSVSASAGLTLPDATPLAEMPNAMTTMSTPGTASTLTTLAASPAPRAAAAAIVSTTAIEGRVKQTLSRYQHAYDSLDARAAAASWPSVDVAALTRAFTNLKSQSLTFDRCTVDVATTSTATASCTGSTTAVRQVGSATPVTRSLHWIFNLRRGGDDTWVIDTVTTTRP